MELARNVELKARVRNLSSAREIARRVASEHLGVQNQVDTYFGCEHGRLKLREIAGAAAQLVWYSRADQSAAKASDYLLVDVADPALLKHALTAALGVQIVVAKRREIYLQQNVRIHLDEVSGLGAFLEFEAVLDPSIDDKAGQAQVAALQAEFGIRTDDLLAVSYSDLLAEEIMGGKR